MKRRLIVLASTYPRWKDDHEPSFVHELARRLSDRFDVVAIVPHALGALPRETLDGVSVIRYRYAPARLETLVNDGGIVTNLRRAAWKWLLVPAFILMQWLAARRHVTSATVVHAHWIVPQGLIGRLLRRPYVITSHGADLFALRGRGTIVAKRFALANCRALTVVSEAMRNTASSLISPERISVRPMGVDLRDLFTLDPAVRRDPNHLLFVGRLVEKKGLDVLLRALSYVTQSYPAVRLSVVGHGPLLAEWRELAMTEAVADRVEFVGPVVQSQLPAWYRSAALFVAPFREAKSGDIEGLGLVLVEALGCGCPVLASDVPATRDVLSGVNGVVTVSPNDVRELADALIASLAKVNEMTASVAASRETLVDRFDWNSVARRYAELLESVQENDL